MRDARPFEEKFREVLSSHSDVMVEQGIPVEVLEAQAGRAIYAKGGNRRLPVSFTYRLTRNGKPLYIRLWKRYEEYDYAANRQVRAYCDMNGIKVLDFFEYMPNAITYMQERIDSALAAL